MTWMTKSSFKSMTLVTHLTKFDVLDRYIVGPSHPNTSCNMVVYSTALYDLVLSNIWGFSSFRQNVSFVNDYSRYTWVYLLKRCSKITRVYKNFIVMIYTNFRLDFGLTVLVSTHLLACVLYSYITALSEVLLAHSLA